MLRKYTINNYILICLSLLLQFYVKELSLTVSLYFLATKTQFVKMNLSI